MGVTIPHNIIPRACKTAGFRDVFLTNGIEFSRVMVYHSAAKTEI